MSDLVAIGSQTAKNGFRNEDFVIERFNNWQDDSLSRQWLVAMNYNLSEIEFVVAHKINGSFKSDIQVQITIEVKLKKLVDVQNIQVKLVSNAKGFNQIDKRLVHKYAELWNIPENIIKILQYFTGELPPYINDAKDSRRMFASEFIMLEQNELINFIEANKQLIISDILKGRGQFAAEWMLVILRLKDDDLRWVLKPMNLCMNLFGNGDVVITKRGSVRIGNITIQRKGGDAGRKTAQMLQFKINPCLLFD